MKITEAFENRQQVIDTCKTAKACKEEFEELVKADNQIGFENVLLRNFTWCVEKGVLECWLPDALPNCKELFCPNTKITALPELPNCEILFCFNTRIKELPELPNCEWLNCRNTEITALPELPNCKWLNCFSTQITALPELPNCKVLYCDNTNITVLPALPNCKELYCRNTKITDFSNVNPDCSIYK